MSISHGAWNLESPIAVLRCGALAARVNVSQPQRGLFELHVAGNAAPGSVMSLLWESETPKDSVTRPNWPAALSEAYVRGNDLVATYAKRADWPFAPQVYWRVESTADDDIWLTALTLWVSIQTDSLDSRPGICVSTCLPADELVHVPLPPTVEQANGQGGESRRSRPPADNAERTAGKAVCMLWRLPGKQFSYAEIIAESDFRHVAVSHTSDGAACVQWDLFAEFLEKGVIRRARLYGLLLPRENDVELAAQSWCRLQSRPLPLTT